MKKITKMLALLMSLIMVLALFAGCTQQPTDKPVDDKPVDDKPVDEGPKEPVKISYARVMDAVTLGYLTDLKETEDDNRWTKLYEEKLNVELDMLWSSATDDDYFTQLNLSVSSGDVPDYIYFGQNYATIESFYEMGVLVNQEPYIEEYATDALKAALEGIGAESFLPITFNGDRYGLSQAMGGENSSYGFLWIRQDWLDNLGLEVPTTMEELYDVAYAFKYNDPDGDGQNNTSGIAAWNCSTKYHTLGLGGLFGGFSAYPERWIEKDGEVVYGSVQPEAKEALTFIHKMYEDGLIDQEFYANNNTAAQEAAIAGRHGLWIGNQTGIGSGNLTKMWQADNDANWIAYMAPTVDGKPVKVGAGYNTKAFYGVSTQCGMPQFLVEVFNLQIDLIWNAETATMENFYYYNTTEDNKSVYKFSLISYEPAGKNAEKQALIQKVLETGDESLFYTVDQTTTWDTLKPYYLEGAPMDGSIYAMDKIFGEMGSNRLMNVLLAEGRLMRDAFYGAPTETMATSLSTLNTMEDEAYIQIITGQQPIEYFDTFVANWMAAGGEQITKEVNEWKASIDLLVSVSYMCYHTSTSDLSTS